MFAAYPVIALLANNIEEVPAGVALRALLISLALSLLLFALLRLVLKGLIKAGISTSVALIVFFSYGHIYNFLGLREIFGLELGRHRVLAPLVLLVTALIIIWIMQYKGSLTLVNSMLNWIGFAALVIPLFQIASFEIRAQEISSTTYLHTQMDSSLTLPADRPAPDIYYIIVDAYARDDTLLEDFNLDNSPFLRQLDDLGFYVARCSQSNYSQTQLSLASSLNMNYLEALGDQYTAGNSSRVGIQELIHHNLVRRFLENLGYTSIAFETGFKGTQWEDADIYYSPGHSYLDRMQITGRLNDFEVMLLRTSAGLLVSDASGLLPGFVEANLDNPRLIHRQRILFTLDSLDELPAIPGPKFVFAHLVIPHPPYVFGPQGEFTDYDIEIDTGYINQVKYINTELVKLVEDLISKSQIAPIIIIQADHGAIHSPPSKRLRILNTYYLPEGGNEALYERISPVNTFRLV
ncbi:MAG: sulfatase-like hydrolase/transferase, partial [Anaerolineales bacterium]